MTCYIYTSKPEVLQYCDILEQFNLTQIVNKPTRITLNRASLIDHIILSDPAICKHTDVLPCPHISDHDGPYAILNVRVPRFQPRLKYIRDEKHLNIEQYVSDINDLPFSLIYAFDDVETKLDIFNSLILDCINKHAPLKKIKVTRPPSPWMQSEKIRILQQERNSLCYIAHKHNDHSKWNQFCEKRNYVKKEI